MLFMIINNNIHSIQRRLSLKHHKSSVFVFGPRLTGKTKLLSTLKLDLLVDLIEPELELEYRRNPAMLWEQLSTLNDGAKTAIDEIQKVPELLGYVQKAIEAKNQQFFLTSSSARKLKRGSANLLGGRALDLRLHPLTIQELGERFNLDHILAFGSLPKVTTLLWDKDLQEARRLLRAYVSIYLKEEIQAEALVRNLAAFQRFLPVAAQMNADMLEFENVSRDCSTPASTVKEYFQILEDTLIGAYLWPFDHSERKKARPKFYFFDCGVIRALQNRLNDPPTAIEKGKLFESWFIREAIRIRDYKESDAQISFWRKEKWEVDLLIEKHGKFQTAIEMKSGASLKSTESLRAFRKFFPKVPLYIVSATDRIARKTEDGFHILPVLNAINLLETEL